MVEVTQCRRDKCKQYSSENYRVCIFFPTELQGSIDNLRLGWQCGFTQQLPPAGGEKRIWTLCSVEVPHRGECKWEVMTGCLCTME